MAWVLTRVFPEAAAPPLDPVFILLAVGGLVSGFLAGLLGIGGALVTVPLLYFALPRFGVSAASLPQAVVASALVAMIPTALAATRSQARQGALDIPCLRRLAPLVAGGASAGAVLALQLNGPVIALAFATQSFCYGARLMRVRSRDTVGPIGRWLGRQATWLTVPLIAAFCACVGMGGGSMVTPYLRCQGLSLQRAVATSGALNLCIAFGGILAFLLAPACSAAASAGVCWPAAVVTASFAVLAAPLGVAIAHRLPVWSLAMAVGAINVAGALALVAHVALAAEPAAQAPAPVASARGATPQGGTDVDELFFRQVALNALLVPLLDADSPSWAEPTLMTPCLGASTVRLDGLEVPYGTALPDRPFQMQWQLVDCWPLGMDAFRLDGSITVTVRREPSRLTAWLQPRGLVLTSMKGRTPITEPFSAEVSLAPSAVRP